jgi:hypothetical protein
MADNGHDITMPARLSPQNAKAILDIMVGDPLDQPRQHLSIGWIGLRLHNARSLMLNHSAR